MRKIVAKLREISIQSCGNNSELLFIEMEEVIFQ